MTKLRHIDWPYRFEILSVHFDPGVQYGIDLCGLEGCNWQKSLFGLNRDMGRWFLDLFWIRILPR